MSNFVKILNRKPSEKYKALLKAARELAEAEGDDEMSRACAEAMIPYEYSSFIRRHNVKPSNSSHVCEERLKGAKRCPETINNPIHLEKSLPAADHLSEWIQDGKTIAITSQPYGCSWQSLREIVAYCNENGLEAEIEAGSWWFPGRTVLITFTKAKS